MMLMHAGCMLWRVLCPIRGAFMGKGPCVDLSASAWGLLFYIITKHLFEQLL